MFVIVIAILLFYLCSCIFSGLGDFPNYARLHLPNPHHGGSKKGPRWCNHSHSYVEMMRYSFM